MLSLDICYPYSNLITKMEESKLSFEQLASLISDWGISSRILEKIKIWEVRHSPLKVDRLPQDFIRNAFFYFILRNWPQLLSDYKQEKLAKANLALKRSYSVQNFKYFNSGSNFDFTMIILSKVLKYFLLAHFAGKFCESSLEPTIYACIVQSILGYSIGKDAYEVIEAKLRERHLLKNRSSLTKFNFSVMRLDSKADRHIEALEKKIHRRGEFNLFRKKNDVDEFRKQIKEILKVKKSGETKADCRKEQKKDMSLDQKALTGWNRKHHSVFNLHQISSSMAMQEGFRPTKTNVSIHITQKRDLKDKICPSFKQIARKNKPSYIHRISQGIVLHVPPFSWNTVIENMRGKKENKEPASQPSSLVIPPRLKVDKQKAQELRRMRTFKTEDFELKAINPSNVEIRTVATPEVEQMGRTTKFHKISFMAQLSKFQSKCKERRDILNQTDYPRMPSESS